MTLVGGVRHPYGESVEAALCAVQPEYTGASPRSERQGARDPRLDPRRSVDTDHVDLENQLLRAEVRGESLGMEYHATRVFAVEWDVSDHPGGDARSLAITRVAEQLDERRCSRR